VVDSGSNSDWSRCNGYSDRFSGAGNSGRFRAIIGDPLTGGNWNVASANASFERAGATAGLLPFVHVPDPSPCQIKVMA
jgi:hypothetical protein